MSNDNVIQFPKKYVQHVGRGKRVSCFSTPETNSLNDWYDKALKEHGEMMARGYTASPYSFNPYKPKIKWYKDAGTLFWVYIIVVNIITLALVCSI